jgi:hypothetical protein
MVVDDMGFSMFHRQYDNPGGENDALAENGGGSLPPSANMPPQNMMRASNQIEAAPMNAPPISQPVPNRANRELGLDGDDMDIPWCDLNIKEKIGAGNNFTEKLMIRSKNAKKYEILEEVVLLWTLFSNKIRKKCHPF